MIISSRTNGIIKFIKSLDRKKNRLQEGAFIVEGIKMVGEALDRGYELSHIVYEAGVFNLAGGRELLESLGEVDKLIEVTREVFEYISDVEKPQGILALGKINLRSLDEIAGSDEKVYLLLDGLQDPGNLGTIIRTADAFKIDGIIIKDGTVDPYNQKVVRATMGSIFRVPIYYMENFPGDLKRLQDLGYRLLATSLEASKDIRKVNYAGTIIVIGNESKGIGDETKELADEFIKIPMPGESESLNAGVASSIIMYEALRDRS